MPINGATGGPARLPSGVSWDGATMSNEFKRVSERKINERTFRVEPMLATKAVTMQARLFRLAGPAIERLPEILRGLGPGKTEAEHAVSNAYAVQAFVDIFSRTDPEELAAMIRELAELAEIKRPSGTYDQVDFDGEFTGYTGDIIPLVVWIAQEQFGDFFSGFLAGGNRKIAGRG